MSNDIFWILELAVKPGHLDAFESLMHEMVAATQANEPDTLNYEWYVSDDKTQCVIHERYTDSAAVMTHLGAFGEHFAERFLAAVDPVRIVVYGTISDEVRAALDTFGAVYMAPWGGFAR